MSGRILKERKASVTGMEYARNTQEIRKKYAGGAFSAFLEQS
jgi:hypothetical protein